MENIVTLTYHGTNYYLLPALGGKLMVDAGWPGSLPTLAARLKAYRLDSAQIKYVLPTHAHPDHAGLVQEIKQAWGARLLIHEQQIAYLPGLAEHYAKKGGYVPIRVEAHDIVLGSDNRQQLKVIGLDGEFIATPGHSDDSFSLVLDSGAAFVGDLTLPQFAGEDNALVHASWRALQARGAQMVYRGHGRPVAMAAIVPHLAPE